ncbi:MAG: cobalamin-binding protein [Gemmatimonadota bacterium]
MRVVSLACSNTEIVCALGCSEMLVGVDDHSDFPADVVASLPRLGPDLEIDIDAVSALEPDLVLATLTVPGHERVVEGLAEAGLPHLAPEPTCVEDVYRDVRRIADLLGVPDRGEALARRMRSELSGRPEPGEDAPSLLVQWWPKPTITPGRLSWTTDVIRAAGGRNPLGDEPVKSRPVPDEEVAELAPDAIVLSWCGVNPADYRPDVVYAKDAWADVPAVRNGHVFCVPEAYMGRPGPRLVEGRRALEEIVGRVARRA